MYASSFHLYTGPPSTPFVDSVEYSVFNELNGQVTLLVISSGTFGTGVRFYGSVESSDSVEVANNNITVTGLSYTGSHTVSVVATSDVCPGVLNSSSVNVPVMFNIRSKLLIERLYILYTIANFPSACTN